MSARLNLRFAFGAILLAAACARTAASRPAVAYPVVTASASANPATSLPPAPPERWLGLLGEYGDGPLFRIVAEQDGHLQLVDSALQVTKLAERGDARFVTDPGGERADFERDATGHGTALLLGSARLARNEIEPRAGTQSATCQTRAAGRGASCRSAGRVAARGGRPIRRE